MEGAQIAAGALLEDGCAIGRGAQISKEVHLKSSIISDGAMVLEGASLDRCFVAAAATVPKAAIYADSYIGKDEVVSLIA